MHTHLFTAEQSKQPAAAIKCTRQEDFEINSGDDYSLLAVDMNSSKLLKKLLEKKPTQIAFDNTTFQTPSQVSNSKNPTNHRSKVSQPQATFSRAKHHKIKVQRKEHTKFSWQIFPETITHSSAHPNATSAATICACF